MKASQGKEKKGEGKKEKTRQVEVLDTNQIDLTFLVRVSENTDEKQHNIMTMNYKIQNSKNEKK